VHAQTKFGLNGPSGFGEENQNLNVHGRQVMEIAHMTFWVSHAKKHIDIYNLVYIAYIHILIAIILQWAFTNYCNCVSSSSSSSSSKYRIDSKDRVKLSRRGDYKF
jgi:hypothetical protein